MAKKEGKRTRSGTGREWLLLPVLRSWRSWRGRGPLTVEQEAELAELRPKVAQHRQRQREAGAEYRRTGNAAADRVAELEVLKEQGPLTVEQEVELAELRRRRSRSRN
ncbi:hypothetical protein [Saccharopolyspora spinosa]|uniref:hypothetical protein n=1 Tax=Saccharopolyspora spinosa TaxID=60894 RepID=UPI00376F4450